MVQKHSELSVLYLDDNHNEADHVRECLTNEQAPWATTVTCENDPNQAQWACKANQPDVLFVGGRFLQASDGEVVTNLRKNHINTPVIMVAQDSCDTVINNNQADNIQGCIPENEITTGVLVDSITQALRHYPEHKLDREEEHAVSIYRGLLDPDGKITSINPAFLQLTNCDEEQIINQAIQDAPWWSDDTDSRVELMRALKQAKNGKNAYVRAHVNNSSENTKTIGIDLRPVSTHDGTVIYIGFEARNETTPLGTENAYSPSSSYYQIANGVLDSIPAAVIVTDATNHIAWVNNAVKEYFDLNAGEILGQDEKVFIRKTLAPMFKDSHQFQARAFKSIRNDLITNCIPCELTGDAYRKKRSLEHSSQPIKGGLYAGGRVNYYQDVTALKEIQRQLETSVTEKQTLLEELHHRVKSNLQTVISFLSFKHKKTENKTEETTINNSINSIQVMADAHERLYQSESFDYINFTDYLKTIVGRTLKGQDNISVIYNTDTALLTIEETIACDLTISELMQNVIDHAVIDNDLVTVTVSVNTQDDACTIMIRDNGPGFDDESEQSGFAIVRALIEYELGGTVLKENKERGACVTASFSPSK